MINHICNSRVSNESSSHRNSSDEQAASWEIDHYAAISSWVGADACSARRRVDELQEGEHFPRGNNQKRPAVHRNRPPCSQSLVFFRTDGVESAKFLIGCRGQVDCTGVGAAELGLINMAL